MIHIVTRYTSETDDQLQRLASSLTALESNSYDWFLVGKGAIWRPVDLQACRIEAPTLPKNDWGYLINLYLDCVPDVGQLVYFLDGDNIFHRAMVEVLKDVTEDVDMLVVDQEYAPGAFRKASMANLVVQQVDIAQVVFRRSFIGDLRAWSVYRNDGYLIQELTIRAKEYGNRIACVNISASYWNAQVWKKD